MSENIENPASELPSVETEQVEELAAGQHAQVVLMEDEGDMYEVRWDGKFLRLLKPAGVSADLTSVSYQILGHLEVDLPMPLEFPTFERHARIIIHSYKYPPEDE